MKKIIKRTIILTFAFLVFAETLFFDCQTVSATGLEEVLYYTYWDLLSTLGYYSGYNSNVNESRIQIYKEDDISGEKFWEKFVNYFNVAKSLNDFILKTGVDAVIDELKNLPNTVTKDGYTLSDDASEMVKEYYPEAVSYAMAQTVDDTAQVSLSFPYGYYAQYEYSYKGDHGGGKRLFISTSAPLLVFGYINNPGSSINGICISDRAFTIHAQSWLDGGYYNQNSWEYHGYYYMYLQNFSYDSSLYSYSFSSGKDLSEYGTIEYYIDNVLCTSAVPDIVYSSDYDIAEEACPEEIPDVRPLRKDIVIPDEWRVLEKTETGTDPDEDPDDSENPEKKKNPNVLPVWIPTTPLSPEPGVDPDPGTSTDPSTDPSINPDSGLKLDPDANQDEMIDSDPVGAVTGKAGDFTTLFPFCIPFDIVRLVKGMRAEKAPPVFHFEYTFKPIKYTLVVDVDLSDYEQYIKIFRYGMQIFYVIALMFLTIKVVKLFI